MATTLASLVVRVGADVRGVTRGMSDAEKRLRGFNSVVHRELTRTRDLFSSLAGAAGAGFAAKAIFDLGARVEETGSKFNTVFGGAAGRTVQTFIDQFALKAGLSNERAQALTASLGGLSQAMGANVRQSAQFSIQATKIAADIASFHNAAGGTAEVLTAMKSALVGEFEPLKRFDILLSAASVQQQALQMTGKLAADTLTQQEKATAVLALVTEQAGVAIGDLARTESSAANQAKQTAAELQNIKETISSALLPAMSVGVTGLNQFIKGLQIMGAEAAVAVAQVELQFAKLNAKDHGVLDFLGLGEGAGLVDPLGLDLFSGAIGADLGKSVAEAEANLARIRAAAEAVKLDIVGLTGALTGGGGIGGDGGGAAGGAIPAVSNLSKRLVELQISMLPVPTVLDSAAQSALNYGNMVDQARAITESVRTPTEAFTQTMTLLQSHLAAGTISWQTYTRAVEAATQALKEQQSQADKVLGKLGQGFGALGALSGALGFAIPGFGTASGLLSAATGFAGLFAHGGHIPSGSFGIVGEKGPEVVQGPANVTPADGGPLLVVNLPPAPDPMAMIYDERWIRALSAAQGVLVQHGHGP